MAKKAQRTVMKIPMTNEETRREAMKIAIKTCGTLKSIAIDGADRNQLVVVGEGIDSARLATQLRKRMGFQPSCIGRWLLFNRKRHGDVELVSVGEAKPQPSKVYQDDKQAAWGSSPWHVPTYYTPNYVFYDPPPDHSYGRIF